MGRPIDEATSSKAEQDDTISRQAALNPNICVNAPRGTKWIVKSIVIAALNAYREYIEKLPTAEPQIIRCKDCKYRILDERYGVMCDLDTGDPYSSGRNAEDDDWFCADAERRQDG